MKVNLKYFIAVIVGIAFVALSANAQLTTTIAAPYNQSQHMIENVFLSSQITAMNFEFNGAANGLSNGQFGFFSGGSALFGIDSGLVMSTGNINTLPVNGFSSASFQGPGDADVLAVAQSVGWGTPPSIMRDRCVLEFDFVAAQDDSVAFEYCFGSEEWPNYPCSQYNDAFGFFISGPGINGTYSNNARNVSIVPGTVSLPVAITSIHNGTGSPPCNGNPSYNQYYNTGPTAQAFAYAAGNAGNFGGAWTDVFQTQAIAVQACDTYHVKLAICDGVDWIFDSSVFLKAKSFEFFGVSVNPQPSYNPFGFDTALYEGCGSLELGFDRVDSTYPPYTLEYKIAGTATMGLDYEQVPNCVFNNNTGVYDCTITFPQDSAHVELDIDIYYDQLAEVFETFDFVITDSAVTMCDGDDTLNLTIVDQPALNLNMFGATTLDCNDPPAFIGVTPTGLPPYTYAWSNGHTDSTQNVQPPVTTAYSVVVEDGCGDQELTGFVTVGVFNVPWQATKIGDKQTINCTSPPVDIAVGVQFNDGNWHGDIDFLWSTGSTDSTISVFSTVDTTYTVTITRNCTQETVVKTFNLYVENDPVITETEDTDVSLIDCPGDPITIGVVASGGYPPYSYQWSDGVTDSSTVVAPLLTEKYYVTVTDVCGLVEYVDSLVVNVPVADPLVIRGVQNDTLACPEMKAHFGPPVPTGGFGFDYLMSWNDYIDTTTYIQEIIYSDKKFTVKLTDGCRADTVEKTVWAIIADKNDLSYELTNDTVMCKGDIIVLEAKGINGGGNYKYFWENSLQSTGRFHTIKPTETTTYPVRIVDQCDTVRNGQVEVIVSEIESDFEYEYVNDYDVRFHDKSWSTDTIRFYDWTVLDLGLTSAVAEPVITMPDGMGYEVEFKVTNDYGCSDVATVLVQPEYHLYIPSSFTPNNDGINETWSIKSLGIREMKLEVYDRWGNTVFSTTDKNFEWDGMVNEQHAPMGAYAWRIVLFTDHDQFVRRDGTLILTNDFQQR